MSPSLHILDGVKFKVGEPSLLINNSSILEVFNDSVVDFLSDLSNAILSNPSLKRFPDLIGFGYWSRKASIAKARITYGDTDIGLGRGMVFHVAPGNIPLMFAYSLVIGLISGNANIVRLPSKDYWQVDFICSELNRLLNKSCYSHLIPYICCVTYDHSVSEATQLFSSICDVRVIWGGDETINKIRQEALKPNAFDVVFSNRHSLLLINSDCWLAANDKSRLIQAFYNDTYLSDQLACSSPCYIIWTGNFIEQARDEFWSQLHVKVEEQYQLQDGVSVGKWTHICRLGSRDPGLRLESLDNQIVRLWSNEIRADLIDGHPGGGIFIESKATCLDDCLPLLGRKCQTLSYYGIQSDVIRRFLIYSRPCGIDRVVPIGKTLDFSFIWDGYDTIRMLSRKVTIA